MSRRMLVLALAALVATPAFAEAPAKDAPAKDAPAFTPIPELQAVHVANPHDHEGKPLCQRCHLPGQAGLTVDPVALCAQCHDPSAMKHPVGVVQQVAPADLPLAAGSRIVCHTCHDPHDVKKRHAGLRLEKNELCMRCHRRHEAKPGQRPSVK